MRLSSKLLELHQISRMALSTGEAACSMILAG